MMTITYLDFNMKEIPQNCIDTFVEKFGTYPSVIELSPLLSSEDVNSFLRKSHLLWYEDWMDIDYLVRPQHQLYEYDSTGILIYQRLNTNIFILTKADKKNAVDYLLLQLKRLTKKQD